MSDKMTEDEFLEKIKEHLDRQDQDLDERIDHVQERLQRGEALHFSLAHRTFEERTGEVLPRGLLVTCSKVLRKLLVDVHSPKTQRSDYVPLRFDMHSEDAFLRFTAQEGSRWARTNESGAQSMSLDELVRRISGRGDGKVARVEASSFLRRFVETWSHSDATSTFQEDVQALLPGMRLRGDSNFITVDDDLNEATPMTRLNTLVSLKEYNERRAREGALVVPWFKAESGEHVFSTASFHGVEHRVEGGDTSFVQGIEDYDELELKITLKTDPPHTKIEIDWSLDATEDKPMRLLLTGLRKVGQDLYREETVEIALGSLPVSEREIDRDNLGFDPLLWASYRFIVGDARTSSANKSSGLT